MEYKATDTDLTFVEYDTRKGCPCACSATVFRTVWDRLCRQIFEAMPPGMDPEDQLPDIDIWVNGVALADESYPYTFTVTCYDDDTPKPSDIIQYKGKYYVIGEVTN